MKQACVESLCPVPAFTFCFVMQAEDKQADCWKYVRRNHRGNIQFPCHCNCLCGVFLRLMQHSSFRKPTLRAIYVHELPVQSSPMQPVFHCRNHGRNVLEFELHGQHVADIRPTVETNLNSCRPLAHTLKYVRFITGRGNHSGPGGPKLAPAVRRSV